MNIAALSAQQKAALTSASNGTAAVGATTATPQTTKAAQATLAGNFDNFLKLLMTQLKNQDPTSPLDTNQFTSQLVQFASVEQQINANTNLTQLIELTQGEQVLQASSLVGKHVVVKSEHIPLQNGTGQVNFASSVARPTAITITTEAGLKVRDAVIDAKAGENQWVWDGRNNAGTQVPDGSYRIAMIGANPDGTVATQVFAVQGIATGVSRQDNKVSLQMGAQIVPFSAVQQVLP